MKNKTLVEKFVEDPKNLRLYQQERAIYEVTELIESTMKDRGVGRSDLAKMIGKSKGWVTQFLDGEANKTVRTVADTLTVLGQEFHFFVSPIQVSNKPTYHETLEQIGVTWGEEFKFTVKIRPLKLA